MYTKYAILLEQAFERVFHYLQSRLALLVAGVVLPITYLFIVGAIDFKTGQWTLIVRTPATPGFSPVFLATENGFEPLRSITGISTPEGDFCTYNACPQLENADLRILVPAGTSRANEINVVGQFVSSNGHIKIDLPAIVVPTYSMKSFVLETKDDYTAASKLPHLNYKPITLPPPEIYIKVPYFLLCGASLVVSILYFISVKRGTGLAAINRISAFPWIHRWGRIIIRNRFVFLILFNAGFFFIAWAFFGQRYQTDDDPAMAMIADGKLSGHPSEYLVYINVIIGLGLKWLSISIPWVNWYTIFIAVILMVSSSIIGGCLINRFGGLRGLFLYMVVFFFYIFHVFCGLQYTSAAALTCLAGVALALSSTEHGASRSIPVPITAVLLMVLGSLIRYESALLVFAIIFIALFLNSILRKRFSYMAFLFISFIGIQGLHVFNEYYYDRSPDWKQFHEYIARYGHLTQRPRFVEYKDNSEVYKHVNWNENDFKMISWHWLYQDAKVFSLDNISYLDDHLANPARVGSVFFSLLHPLWFLFWMPLVVIFYIFNNWLAGRLSALLVAGIGIPIILILLSLSVTARLPDRVFLPTMLGAFLLTALFSEDRQCIRADVIAFQAYGVFVGLLAMFCSFTFLLNNARIDLIRTSELKRSLNGIAFLKDKVFISSISSLYYEDFSPYENWHDLKNPNFIDIMWTYPSPDLMSAFRRNGISEPFVDLVKQDKLLLLVPTFAWDRGAVIQRFLHDHYQMNVDYEIVKDPNGRPCCYTNFTVLRFFPAKSEHIFPVITNELPTDRSGY